MKQRAQSDHLNQLQVTSAHTSENKIFLEWLEQLPQDYLKEQLNQIHLINQKINKQGFNYVLSKEESYHFLKQFLKEKFEQQTQAIDNQNKEIKERFKQLQDRFHNTIQNQQILKGYFGGQNKNVAATRIQKVWRGFHTRKFVFQFQPCLMDQQKESTDLKKQINIVVPQRDQPENHFVPDSYDSEIQRLKNSQINQWDLMIKSVKSFKSSSSLTGEAVNFLELLEKQSEMNRKILSGEIEINQKIQSKVIRQEEKQTNQCDQIALNENANKKDLHQFVDPDLFVNLFKFSQEKIEEKYCQQVLILEKMLEMKKVSRIQFQSNLQRIDRKKNREQRKLEQTKSEVERIKELYKSTVSQTEKDLKFLERIKKYDKSFFEEENLSVLQIFSLRSESDQSECGEPTSNRHVLSIISKNNSVGHLKRKGEQFQVSQSGSSIDNISNSIDYQRYQQVLGKANQQILIQEDFQENSSILRIDEISNQGSPHDNKQMESVMFDRKQRVNDGERVELLSDKVLEQLVEEFAMDLKRFPRKSLGVLIEYDDEIDCGIAKVILIQGFPTGLNFIKDYLQAFSDFIQSRRAIILQLENFLDQLQNKISIPFGISPVDLLKIISMSLTGADSEKSSSYPLLKHIQMIKPVLEEDVWEKFNVFYSTRLKYLKNSEIEYAQMKDLEMCHLKMVFDAFNESLNYIRPYAVRGLPYPWWSNPRKLCAHFLRNETIQDAMGFAVNQVLKWGGFLCGFIPEKIQTSSGEILIIEEDYLNQIKEDRLQKMIENEVQRNEESWLSYDEEQTAVCMELSDVLLEWLLEESSEELLQINLK